ncbi:MAG: hypothetical protein ACLPN6_20110 [Streptosporangiaceae bacterium]|jgi:hypothetical protein|nr:hypothetical protein [Actinomycetota bacterium]
MKCYFQHRAGVLGLLAATALLAACGSVLAPKAAVRPHDTTAAAAATRLPAVLCTARMTSGRPENDSRDSVLVRTVAQAQIRVTAHYAIGPDVKSGDASSHGQAMVWYYVNATPGYRVIVNVTASSRGQEGWCWTAFIPLARPKPTPKPDLSPVARKPVAPASPAAPAPSAHCRPLSDKGTCYEPGEYCRSDDHGMAGVAGDGKAIRCEDKDGWRWEPY